MLNLNNEVFGFYNGSERYPIQREYYDRTISVGLRWTPFAKGTRVGSGTRGIPGCHRGK